jgi:hypothetical protein
MNSPQFSLRILLIATAYLATMLGGFVAGSTFWADLIFSLTISIILVATLAALFYGNITKRIYWRGFCVTAWIYLLLAFGTWAVGQVRGHLVTDELLRPIHRLVTPIHAARRVEPGFELRRESENYYQTGPRSAFEVWGGTWQATQRIGHSAWAILLGLISGYLAIYFSNHGKSQLPTNRHQIG